MKTFTVNKVELNTHRIVACCVICKDLKAALYWQGQIQRAEPYRSPFGYVIKATKSN